MNKTFFVHITFYKTFVDEIETKTYKIVCVPSHIRNEVDKIFMAYRKEHPECIRFHSDWKGKYNK